VGIIIVTLLEIHNPTVSTAAGRRSLLHMKRITSTTTIAATVIIGWPVVPLPKEDFLNNDAFG
jgi:predicted secreted protein